MFQPRPRLLNELDIPAALELSTLAGWNQTAADWRLLLDLEPEGCFAVESDGQVVATATLFCYGEALAWVGMVLTHHAHRRRGYARSLVKEALSLAEKRRIRTVKLDATESGMGLYTEFGFLPEGPMERWIGQGSGVGKSPRGPSSAAAGIDGIFELDRRVFPANRSRLLKNLLTHSSQFCCEHGYLLRRAGSRASYVGPCVAGTATSARSLFEDCLLETTGPIMWDLPPDNGEARKLATDLGFKADRHLVRMYRGNKLEESHDHIYAIAGFELG